MTADDELMTVLGAIAQVVDPVPAHVSELARAAFTLRRLDEELAELVEDSAGSLAGVRSAVSDVRLLVFQAGDVVVEVQVSGEAPLLLLGQVSAEQAPAGTVRVETSRLEPRTVALDGDGAFRVEDVPAGTMRLVIELAGGRTLTTRWFSA